jgi:hypothetical protein
MQQCSSGWRFHQRRPNLESESEAAIRHRSNAVGQPASARWRKGLGLAIWTRRHGDHIGQADQFIADSIEYVGEGDRQAVAGFLERREIGADGCHCARRQDGKTMETYRVTLSR